MTNEWQFLTTATIIKLGKNIVGRKMGTVTSQLITPVASTNIWLFDKIV